MLYDRLPPGRAAAAAWTIMGRHPAYHATQQQRLRDDWPELAHALDRLAELHAPELYPADDPDPWGDVAERVHTLGAEADVIASHGRTDRRELTRTGAGILATTALAAIGAAWVIGSTAAWLVLGTLALCSAAAAAHLAWQVHRD